MARNGYDGDLFDAAEFGDADFAEMLLGSPDVDVNAQDAAGVSILMLAAYYGHQNMVRLVLRHGANPNLKDRQGRSALQRAVTEGHHEVAMLLKQAGAV